VERVSAAQKSGGGVLIFCQFAADTGTLENGTIEIRGDSASMIFTKVVPIFVAMHACDSAGAKILCYVVFCIQYMDFYFVSTDTNCEKWIKSFSLGKSWCFMGL
jgi:hypothetical protein